MARETGDGAQGLSMIAVEVARRTSHARTAPRARGLEPVELKLFPRLVIGALSRRRPLATTARREHPERLGQLRGS